MELLVQSCKDWSDTTAFKKPANVSYHFLPNKMYPTKTISPTKNSAFVKMLLDTKVNTVFNISILYSPFLLFRFKFIDRFGNFFGCLCILNEFDVIFI